MRKLCGPVLLVLSITLCSSMAAPRARASVITPNFTISATNVTMPLSQGSCSNGVCTVQYGISTFTLTSVDGYTGAPQVVSCAVANPPAGAVLPTCYQHGLIGELSANGKGVGEILFIAPGQTLPPSPAALMHRTGRLAGTALAAVFLFGIGLRRRAKRWFSLVLLATGVLTGLAAISACGGSGNSMTPGTYAYNVTATDANGVSAATTVNVTIP